MLTNVKAGGIRCVEILYIVDKAGLSSATGGQWGFRGGALAAAAILQFFSKKYAFFKHSLV